MRVTKYNLTLTRETKNGYEIKGNVSNNTDAENIASKIFNDVSTWHNEKFGMLCFDNNNTLIGYHLIFEGTINESAIYPREIVSRALLNNAAAVIFCHNHPANTIKPSQADINLTNKMDKILNELNIKLLDHLILTVNDENKTVCNSMRANGYI